MPQAGFLLLLTSFYGELPPRATGGGVIRSFRSTINPLLRFLPQSLLDRFNNHHHCGRCENGPTAVDGLQLGCLPVWFVRSRALALTF